MLLTKATRDPLVTRQTSENRFLFFFLPVLFWVSVAYIALGVV